jgi:tetratricopeptide (TPR) repeat protein
MAYDAGLLSTGDTYTSLSAKESFEQAIQLDPEFSLAHLRLANFWRTQMSSTNFIGGIVELPFDEMRQKFDNAIEKAIETEQDPVNVLRYRILRAYENAQYAQALRLNTEFLEQRPNDQSAQNRQLGLLGVHSRDDELIAAIHEYQGRDGYDVIVSQASMTLLLISEDNEAIRTFTKIAMDRVGDNIVVVYQAHRALLWAGDVDGASLLVTMLRSSDLPEENRLTVQIRQACAENRVADATRIHDRLKKDYGDKTSVMWITNSIMGNDQDAYENLRPLDDEEDLGRLGDFLTYAYFDAKPFPNLMALLESQGIEPREAREIPYRCKA